MCPPSTAVITLPARPPGRPRWPSRRPPLRIKVNCGQATARPSASRSTAGGQATARPLLIKVNCRLPSFVDFAQSTSRVRHFSALATGPVDGVSSSGNVSIGGASVAAPEPRPMPTDPPSTNRGSTSRGSTSRGPPRRHCRTGNGVSSCPESGSPAGPGPPPRRGPPAPATRPPATRQRAPARRSPGWLAGPPAGTAAASAGSRPAAGRRRTRTAPPGIRAPAARNAIPCETQ